MTDAQRTECLQRQYHAANWLQVSLDGFVGLAHLEGSERAEAQGILVGLSAKAGMEEAEFLKVLQRSAGNARGFALQRTYELRTTLAGILPSADKARSYLLTIPVEVDNPNALLFMKQNDQVGDDHPSVVRLMEQVAKSRASDDMSLYIGDTSQCDSTDCIYWFNTYRLLEEFIPMHAPDRRAELEGYFRRQILSAYMDWTPQNRDDYPANGVNEIGLSLWLCAQSKGLSLTLNREIDLILERMIEWCEPSGAVREWFEDVPGEPWSWESSVHATALMVIALLRLGDDRFGDQSTMSARWLCSAQNEDGSWPTFVLRREPRQPRVQLPGAILTTVLVLEALRRSGIDGISHQVARGEKWLLEQQEDVGSWSQKPYDDDFLTTTVVNYFALRSGMLPRARGYLSMSRDFLRRAERLAISAGHNARRESVILATHGIEMFLYGAFQTKGWNFYKPKNAETIGLRGALEVLEEQLKAGPLTYFTQIHDMVGRRDAIIHRAGDIDEDSLSLILINAREFIGHYSLLLDLKDILQ